MATKILKEGDRGPSVRNLQTLLTKNGTNWRYYYGEIDADFGPLTAKAVRRAKWTLGYAKSSCNQQAGAVLRKLLRDPDKRSAAMKTRAKVRYQQRKEAAVAEGMAGKAWREVVARLGHAEVPPRSNKCPETREWGHGPMAWCGVLVSLCYLVAGSKAFSKVQKKYQYVPALVAAAQSSSGGLKVVKLSELRKGDLVVWRTSTSKYGHVSMYGSWTDADHDFMVEIGGNEGIVGVVKRDVSPVRDVTCCVRVTG